METSVGAWGVQSVRDSLDRLRRGATSPFRMTQVRHHAQMPGSGRGACMRT